MVKLFMPLFVYIMVPSETINNYNNDKKCKQTLPTPWRAVDVDWLVCGVNDVLPLEFFR